MRRLNPNSFRISRRRSYLWLKHANQSLLSMAASASDSDVEFISSTVFSWAAAILGMVKVHLVCFISVRERKAILSVSRNFLDIFQRAGFFDKIIGFRACRTSAFLSFLAVRVECLDKLPTLRAVWCKNSDDPEATLLSLGLSRLLAWSRYSFKRCDCRSAGILCKLPGLSSITANPSWRAPWFCLNCNIMLCGDCEMTIPCDSCGHTYCVDCDNAYDFMQEVLPDKYYCRPCLQRRAASLVRNEGLCLGAFAERFSSKRRRLRV